MRVCVGGEGRGGVFSDGAAGERCVCGGGRGEETEAGASKIFYSLRAKCRCQIVTKINCELDGRKADFT